MSKSPNGVKTLAPAGAIKPTGPWSLGTRAGDFIYVAGMRGIDPSTDILVQGDEARIRQAFINMKRIAQSEGASGLMRSEDSHNGRSSSCFAHESRDQLYCHA